MILLYTILTVFSFFNIALYSYMGESKTSNFILDYIEIGNIGYASSVCEDVSLGIGKLTLE